MSQFKEHEFEPVAGLPERLPQGEFLRWQGKPVWQDLAVTIFHVRKLAVYFAVLLVLRGLFLHRDGLPAVEILTSVASLALLAFAALGMLALLAWLTARSCRFTITNRRIVIRSGIALPVTVNLPFDCVVAADYRGRKNGAGDIALTMDGPERPSWMILWPFVRPWSIASVRPMLRAVPESERVARIVSEALAEFSVTTATTRKPLRVNAGPRAESPPGADFPAGADAGAA